MSWNENDWEEERYDDDSYSYDSCDSLMSDVIVHAVHKSSTSDYFGELIKRFGAISLDIPAGSVHDVSSAIDNIQRNVTKDLFNADGNQRVKQTSYDMLYYAEDEIPSGDISIVFEGIGKINFPLELDTIEKMQLISDKTSKIKVDFNEQALTGLLSRVKKNLNLDSSCGLKLHLYDMFIYGSGQFSEFQRNIEKIKNMVATLLFVLPSKHKGGQLTVRHLFNNMSVVPGDMENIRVVMFYTYCQHEVRPVTEGFKIILAYNVELEPNLDLAGAECLDVDSKLETAVVQHFSDVRKPMRLVIVLDHYYSEESLKWELMKGIDRTVTRALLALGKKHNYKLFLTLSHNMILFVGRDRREFEYFTDATAKLYNWVDENNVKVHWEEKLNRYDIQNELVGMLKHSNYTVGYREERDRFNLMPADGTRYWFSCACVVMIADSTYFDGILRLLFAH